MKNILRNTSVFLLFLVPFIPLYVNNALFFPFITGKAFAFRIIVEILAALWLLLILRDKKYAPKFSWLLVASTAFVVAILVTDLLGLNPLRSLWSNFERMEGWLTLVHVWAYFLAAASIFGSGEDGKRMWHRYFNTTLVAAAIVGMYGFFQLFGWAEIHQGSTRIDASLGNAIYMAVYMLFHAFLAIYMALAARAKNKQGLVWLYIILAVVFAFLLFETSTRGTILGLVGGGMLALAIFALFGKGENRRARYLSGGAIVLIILLGVLLVSAKDTPFVKGNATLNRLATISWAENKSQARGYIWPMAVKEVFESPKTALIGVGQENFNYIFNENYDPRMWGHEQWFDRAHNVYLDWLVAGGLVGLLLYLSLYVLAFIGIWKSDLRFSEKTVLTGLFTGYAIHNVFVFDNLVSYMIFFTLLGFIHSLRAEKPIGWLAVKDDPSENAVVVRDYIFLPAIVILFLAAFYFVIVRPYQANVRLIAAMIGCNSNPSAELYARALKLDQTVANQEIREQLWGCAGNVIRGGYPEKLKLDFYALAAKEIEKQIQTTPNDARTYSISGSFFNRIGDWERGRPVLERAVELTPRKQTTIFELATNYINSGREKEALEMLEEAYYSAPDNENAKIAYMTILILNGQEAKAREVASTTPGVLTDQRIVNVYVRLKQYSKVVEIYRSRIAQDPQNIQYYGALAGIYFESKQYSLALATLEEMKKKFPLAASEVDAAIAQVRAEMNK